MGRIGRARNEEREGRRKKKNRETTEVVKLTRGQQNEREVQCKPPTLKRDRMNGRISEKQRMVKEKEGRGEGRDFIATGKGKDEISK